MINEAYQIKIQQLLSILNALMSEEFTVRNYLVHQNINKVYLYFDKQDIPLAEPIILEFMKDKGQVQLLCISSSDFPVEFGFQKFFGFINVKKLNDLEPLQSETCIICRPGFNEKIQQRLQQHGFERIIWLQSLLIDMRNYFIFSKPLSELAKRIPGLQIIVINQPEMPKGNQSENEKEIIDKKITLRQILAELKDKNELIISAFAEFTYNSPVDIKELLTAPKSYFDENGLLRIEDCSGRFINVKNGIRITCDVPQNPKHNIFVMGNCNIFGHGAPDSGTIQSYLQRLLNNNGYGEIFEVVNLGAYLTNRWKAYAKLIESVPAKNGDILILRNFVSLTEVTKLIKGVIFVDLQNIFDRSHDYGEVIYDSVPHLTENGNHMIARQLYRALAENDMFQKSDLEYPPERQYNITAGKKLIAEKYIPELTKYLQDISCFRESIGCIVMNCNPFTLGHRYLIEQSSKKVSRLFIFVVEEDKSIFSFEDRIELVRLGTDDIPNVTVIPSGKFIISSLTFTDYFGKSELQDRTIDSSIDVEIFGKYIAPAMGINIRFAGDEPLDNVTKQYNDTMRKILPQYGIDFEVIPRKEYSGMPISASLVRALLETQDFNSIRKIVPSTTYKYLTEKYSRAETLY